MVDKFSECVKIVRGHPAALKALFFILETMGDKASNSLLHSHELHEVYRAQGKLTSLKNLEGLFKDG